jgi:hypothetical protein
MRQTSQTYVNDQSFEAYIKYLALKKHFTTDSYDYFKYNGKVKASFDTFNARNDAYFFAKLAKKEDYLNLILANIIVKPEIWVREILDSEAESRYIEWKRKQDSLSYLFKTELGHLNDDYQLNFVSRDGQHPYIMTLYNQKKISLETFTILAHTANIFSYWSEKVVDKIVARDIIKLARKYKPFLAYDEKKFKATIRDRFF